MLKKIILISLVTLCVPVVLHFALSSSSPPPALALQTHFCAGRYKEMESALRAAEKRRKTPLAYERAYLLAITGQNSEALMLFERAFQEQNSPLIRQEITLAMALLAFEKGQLPCFQERLERAASVGEVPALLRALSYYTEGRFDRAVDDFSLSLERKEREGSYLCALCTHLYPKKRLNHYKVSALIENGQGDKARKLLTVEEEGTTFALLAASHLPIAGERASETSYKLATLYLERASLRECPAPIASTIIQRLQGATETLLRVEGATSRTLTCIATLGRWDAKEALEELSKPLARSLLLLPAALEKPQLRCVPHLKENLLALLLETPSKSLCEQFPSLFAQGASQETSEAIALATEHAIEKDSDDLSSTAELLQLFLACEKNAFQKSLFAKRLLYLGKLLWLQAGSETKGTHLFALLLDLCDTKERKGSLKEIERFFAQLYKQAEGANRVERLYFIHDALEILALDTRAFTPQGHIANYLADADYLFKVKNFSATKTHAALILKIEPKNENALRLHGLSLFHLGDYAGAVASLNQLRTPDPLVTKALMTCASLLNDHLSLTSSLATTEDADDETP